MTANTKIEWADHTFNPWIGCTRVSPGCDNCYAATQDKFRHWTPEGWGGPRRRTSPSNWHQPHRWEAQHAQFYAQHGRRQRVFCASLADVFDNQVPDEWFHDLMVVIQHTPNLDWLLLTKRPQNIVSKVRGCGAVAGNGTRYLPVNAQLGTTAEDQKRADLNIPTLLKAKQTLGARVAFVSIEPMLGPVDLISVWVPNSILRNMVPAISKLDWVIVGGESGHGARPMHPDWVCNLRDQCQDAGVPFLFKQWGEWMPESSMTVAQRMRDVGQLECLYTKQDGSTHWIDDDKRYDASDVRMVKFGKKAAGRQLDGREWNEVPAC